MCGVYVVGRIGSGRGRERAAPPRVCAVVAGTVRGGKNGVSRLGGGGRVLQRRVQRRAPGQSSGRALQRGPRRAKSKGIDAGATRQREFDDDFDDDDDDDDCTDGGAGARTEYNTTAVNAGAE